MAADDAFFASASPVEAEERAPAPHELRVEFLRPPEARTRWHPTVTTFGPWLKVPISVFLVMYQLVRIVQAVKGGRFQTGPPLAFELVSVVFYYAVVAMLLKAIWANGKKDGRRLGG